MTRTYLTVAIPYVNARPHLGYAYELVAADLRARGGRQRGDEVRLVGGTDDNALKNVLAAEQAGLAVRAFVDAHAERFIALGVQLGVRFDDFVRTSADPRHRPAVERLWRAVEGAGDLYRAPYVGSYCVGCEDFYADDALVPGRRCPEHLRPVEVVEEDNWFFRLSRYQGALLELVEADELRIRPDVFRREVLAVLRAGLRDISVSRSVARARSWGIPVPGDPSQVVYVWFDALTNYLSGLELGLGTGGSFAEWWSRADQRVHVIGKGILRFHAVYWPAFLLSAGLPLPTELWVHPYLTASGAKLSKSGGNVIETADVVDVVGVDGLRWWFARDVAESTDTDVTLQRIVDRVNADLANTIGNAVSRVAALCSRSQPGTELASAVDSERSSTVAERVTEALSEFRFQDACRAVVEGASEVNRRLDAAEPWKWATDQQRLHELDALLADLVGRLLDVGEALAPIAPALAARIPAELRRAWRGESIDPVFPRVDPSRWASAPLGQRQDGQSPTRSRR